MVAARAGRGLHVRPSGTVGQLPQGLPAGLAASANFDDWVRAHAEPAVLLLKSVARVAHTAGFELTPFAFGLIPGHRSDRPVLAKTRPLGAVKQLELSGWAYAQAGIAGHKGRTGPRIGKGGSEEGSRWIRISMASAARS